jgi:hypothetical protein
MKMIGRPKANPKKYMLIGIVAILIIALVIVLLPKGTSNYDTGGR